MGTIVNDDTSLAINNVSAAEGHSGTRNVTFTVTRRGVLSGTSSATWTTENGTAVAPEDYCAVPARSTSHGTKP